MITNKDAEPIQPENRGQVNPVSAPGQVEAAESERFSDLMKDKKTDESTSISDDDATLTPEELQRQIRENIFKTGFNRTMEKAREIAKELREG